MDKKYQIFISSTYTDLKEERQAAVEAILDSGNIPAGMELFKAGNETQLEVVKRWIDQSDIYMLILGGRYGSVERKTGKSYTHLEYEYALARNMPVFSVVLSDQFLLKKASVASKNSVFENKNKKKYDEFKELVMSKIIRHADDVKDIKLSILTTLKEIIEMNDTLLGWIRPTKYKFQNCAISEAGLNKITWDEYIELVKKLVSKLRVSESMGGFYFDAIVGVNKGGLVTADLIGRMYSQNNMQVFAVYADRRLGRGDFESDALVVSNMYLVNALQSNRIKQILLVDTVSRHGIAFNNAYNYLKKYLPDDKVIKCALIYADKNYDVHADYVIDKIDTTNVVFPYQYSIL